ncbi:site-specific DNA-methyltransferase [Zoogloea sp.]|uniref:site-specific DNA-methyltransferase n=1 Tax=Zoogloea sp. TaxID=49181 RepID=UPI0035AE7E57
MPFLDWVNKNHAKDTAREVPYHLLKRQATYGDEASAADNLLIQGDNLLALKALLPFYAGRVKCIFIDPPYNTQSAFEHYDDRLEHSQWLSMMYSRLALLRDLLAEDGSIWVSLDDNEAHYMKVLGDEVFGRQNFILDVAWQKRDGPPNDRKIGSIHDHILAWAKSRPSDSRKTLAEEKFNLMPRTEKADAQYQVFSEPNGPDPRGPFRKIDTTANGKGGRYVESLYYPVTNPFTGEEVWPRTGTCWRHNRDEMARLQAENRLFWGAKGTAKTPMRKLFKTEAKQGMSAPSIWADTGLNQHGSSEMEKLFGEKAAFETPKPEALLNRIIHIASSPGDLVLDSFLGSGTTAAVAHKMGRRYIGIEMGEHARTHCVPRLEKVIAGEQGGISETVGWQGGGGFSFLTLGEPAFDEDGRLNAAVKFPTLAAYVWHVETGSPGQQAFDSPFLGMHEGKAYFLLYNGILGDRRPAGGNVLTSAILAHLRALCPDPVPFVVYGETARVGPARMFAEGVTFKQIPYDVTMR